MMNEKSRLSGYKHCVQGGKYRQGKGYLKHRKNNQTKHCCLGVLCDLYDKTHVAIFFGKRKPTAEQLGIIKTRAKQYFKKYHKGKIKVTEIGVIAVVEQVSEIYEDVVIYGDK